MAEPAAYAGATIAFDLDGTLVDTAPDLIGTLNLILADEGLPALPLAEARPFIGRGARWLLKRGFEAAGAEFAEDKADQRFAAFIDLYKGRIAEESRPFPGLLPALDALRDGGARLAVCTNKLTGLSLALLDALDLTSRFDAVVGADLAPAAKPDPRHLQIAVEKAGGDPARAILVGDAATDAGAARAAGAGLILVSFGYTEVPAADLAPDELIDHFDELPHACARLLAACSRPAGAL